MNTCKVYSMSTEGQYYRTFNGKNCVQNDILSNEEECKSVTRELGLGWDRTDTFDTRPAGCFHHDDMGYFNQLKVSFSTNPTSIFESMGAVCKRGILLIVDL